MRQTKYPTITTRATATTRFFSSSMLSRPGLRTIEKPIGRNGVLPASVITMGRRLRRARWAALVAVAVLLTGCTTVTDGSLDTGSNGAPFVPAADAHLKVNGGTSEPFDQEVQNALSDVFEFWNEVYPSVSGGKPLPPITGGLYSYDGLELVKSLKVPTYMVPAGCQSGDAEQDVQGMVDNAWYCGQKDSIGWDRTPTHLVGVLAKTYGPLVMAAVFSHEFGHAIQGPKRLDLKTSQQVYYESQADCAAGAFLAWAKDGHAPHFRPNDADIDRALAGYLQVRDGVPDQGEDLSHGNGFDRLAAVANGIAQGVKFCYDPSYYSTTKLTERPYTTDSDYESGGNMPLEDALNPDDGMAADLNRFWKAAAGSINKTWTDVQLKQAAHPACGAQTPASEFGYCPDDNTVYYSHPFAETAYNSLEAIDFNKQTADVSVVSGQPADFALGTLMAIAWGQAVRHQLFGESNEGADGLLAAVCYTGAYAKDINLPESDDNHPLILSPPDLDEATSAVVNLVGLDQAFSSRGTSGLQRVQSFVKGYNGGLSVC